MNLLEVSVKDFGCYAEFTLPLAGQGLVYVVGHNDDSEAAISNGSGKSTLFKAVTWCLYGETVDGLQFDEVIRHGAKKAEVRVKLDNGFTVERTRSKGKPGLRLLGVDGTPADMTPDKVQTKVIEWLGLDLQAFRNTVLYGQGDAVRFADPRTKDSERKAMLSRILRTEIFEHCHKEALAKRVEYRADRDAMTVEVAKLEAALQEHDVDGLEGKAKGWQREVELACNEHREQAARYIAEGREWEERADFLPEAERKLEKYGKALEKATSAPDPVVKLTRELDGVRGELVDIQGKRAKLQASRTILKEQLEGLAGERCPACNSPLKSGEAGKHISELKAKVASAGSAEEPLIMADEEARQRRGQLEKQIEDERAKARHREKTDRERLYEFARLKESVGEMRLAQQKVKSSTEKAKAEMQAIKKASAEKNPWEAMLGEARGRVEQCEHKLKQLAEQTKGLDVDLAHLEFWVRGFSIQGLPSWLLDSVMGYITDRANHYLGVLADGDISVNFSTQRELKSKKGEVRDEIRIDWEIEGIPNVPPSGGQWKKIAIATDLALMDLVATREGGHTDLLMMDEVLDGLDAEGRQRVLVLLRELRKSKSSVFVISHEADLAEEFEHVVRVHKRSGVAWLKPS